MLTSSVVLGSTQKLPAQQWSHLCKEQNFQLALCMSIAFTLLLTVIVLVSRRAVFFILTWVMVLDIHHKQRSLLLSTTLLDSSRSRVEL
jgi:hypothetical protein